MKKELIDTSRLIVGYGFHHGFRHHDIRHHGYQHDSPTYRSLHFSETKYFILLFTITLLSYLGSLRWSEISSRRTDVVFTLWLKVLMDAVTIMTKLRSIALPSVAKQFLS